MKNKISFVCIEFLFILSIFISSCVKQSDTAPDPIDPNYGGGTLDCSYPELNVDNLPQMKWILEGIQTDYQSYSSNQYFKFGSPWLANSLCGGVKKVHNGWDIHRPNFAEIKGKKIYAAYLGLVKVVYNAGAGFAQGLTIEHIDNNGNLFTTNYTHIEPLINLQGQNVTTGQLIGYVADLAENDHLHFSVRRAPYSNFSNRGALPKYQGNNNCSCNNDPVFPEYFVNPSKISFTASTNCNNLTLNNGPVVPTGGGCAEFSPYSTGGTPPYQYKLNLGAWQSSSIFIVCAGTHTFYTRDSQGCESQLQRTF